MRPEDALDAARAEVARRRAAGGYAEPPDAPRIEAAEELTRAQLLEWGLIEPDTAKVYSTRRGGAPITWVKRMLLRGLRQYHNELTSQQTRFNVHLLRRVLELEDRVEELERERRQAARERDGGREP